MDWFLPAFLTAFISAIEAAYIKKYFSQIGAGNMALYPTAYSVPFFLLLFLMVDKPDLSPDYWQTFWIMLPLNCVGILCYFYALNLAPLSLVMPYFAFTPAFALITGKLILNEQVNIWGGTGIVLIIAGGYVLNMNTRKTQGLWAPLLAIFSQPGARAMLLAAFLFSLSSVLGKKAVLEADPLYFAASFFLAEGLILSIILLISGRAQFTTLTKHPLQGFFLGLLVFIHLTLHAWAVSLTKAAYMIAIKRFNAIFAVLIGGWWLGEKGISSKLCGTAIMVAGATMIALLGY